jgi:sterol desaturase/sphingolipid hydroxylase (fatty acid hydroxylase superfamily)
MDSTNWKHFRPFFIYPPIALAILAYTLMHNIYGPVVTVLLLLMGLVEWVLLEYVLHRFFFHIETSSPWLYAILKKVHMTHHAETKSLEYMFVPVSFGLSLTALSIWLRTLIIWPWQGAVIVTIGIWAGYLWYEFIHYSAHRMQSRNPVLRYLKIYHLKHHFQDEKRWFGVTTPFMDMLFRTYRPIKLPALNRSRPGS